MEIAGSWRRQYGDVDAKGKHIDRSKLKRFYSLENGSIRGAAAEVSR